MALDPRQFPSEVTALMRSEIHLCDYNPRSIDDEGRKALRRSIKKFGVLGGIIVNRRSSWGEQRNVVCSGNQKVILLDAINKYDPRNPTENDYELRCEVVDVDEKTEKEIVVVMNNQNVGGTWDYNKLREIIPDIDYRDVGFNDADLSMIGVDFMFQSDGEAELADTLSELMEPVRREREKQKEKRRMERAAMSDADYSDDDLSDDSDDYNDDDEGDIDFFEEDEPGDLPKEKTYEERREHMRNVKRDVNDKAIDDISKMDAYFMVSFADWDAKTSFLAQWGYDPKAKFIKGEDFARRIDGFDSDDE